MFSHFFSKRGLGIDISTKYLRFIQLRKKNQTSKLVNFGRIAIPKDVFSGDELHKPSVLLSLLRQILNETGERSAFFTLPSNRVQFFTLALPESVLGDLVPEIEFALKEQVLFNAVTDIIIEHRIIGISSGEVSIRVAIAPRVWWQRFDEVFRALRLREIHFERPNQSALTALSSERKPTPCMYIHFGDDESSFSVVHNERVVEYGEFPFSNHRFLLEVQKRLTKPGGTASGYLSTLGVYGADVRDFSHEIIQSFLPVVEYSLTSFAKDKGEYVRAVFVGGAFGGYKGVSETLGKNLRLSVESAYPWDHFDPRFDESIFDMKKSETLEYMVPLGLALDMIHTKEAKDQKTKL